jgi:hypothetical protein
MITALLLAAAPTYESEVIAPSPGGGGDTFGAIMLVLLAILGYRAIKFFGG